VRLAVLLKDRLRVADLEIEGVVVSEPLDVELTLTDGVLLRLALDVPVLLKLTETV